MEHPNDWNHVSKVSHAKKIFLGDFKNKHSEEIKMDFRFVKDKSYNLYPKGLCLNFSEISSKSLKMWTKTRTKP